MPPKISKDSSSTEKAKPKVGRKPREPVVLNVLQEDGSAPVPITVKYEGSSPQARPNKTGSYEFTIKLNADAPFTLRKTIAFPAGHEFEGHQGILILPAKSFPFMKLCPELRIRIYKYYFDPKGTLTTPITLDGKRAGTKELYAKTYAGGKKNRVALLRLSKEINAEAKAIFYSRTLRFENTNTLIDFLSAIPVGVREQLRGIQIKTLVKSSSRQALSFLAEAKNINKLRIEQGVASEGDPIKTAKAFYADAHKFLEAVAESKEGDKQAAVNVLSFGKHALQLKDKNENSKPWPEPMVAEFKELLVGKLK